MAKWLGLLIGGLIGNGINPAALVLLAISGYLLGAWLELRSDPMWQFRKKLSKDQEAFKHLLHQATFMMMGYLAKSDGRVSEQEIATAEAIFDSFHLNAKGRKDAIRLFNAGKDSEFQLDSILLPLSSVAKRHKALIKVFLEIQARMVIAEGGVNNAHRRPFLMIARQLGVTERAAMNILRRVSARSRTQSASSSDELTVKEAYALLDVPNDCSSQELKTAYRRAMSEHHPDKLISEGATDQMIQTATEQTQLIQSAYQTVTKARSQTG